MRSAIFSAPFFILLGLLTACGSSDGSGGGGGGTTHTQNPSTGEQPSDGSAPLASVAISVTGKGAVVSRDTHVDCTSDGTTTSGTCSAYYETTLYAEPELGWSFSHWEPAVSDTSAYLITIASPATVTAVFTQD